MRAVFVTAYGGPENLELRELPRPEPARDRLLVRVDAAGVNFHDVIERRGGYPGQPEPPIRVGLEAAGEVVEVGTDATGVSVGDRVVWAMEPGSHAELVEVPVDAAVTLPPGIETTTAAALFSQGLTAHYLTNALHRFQPGETALVWAAAGGVGRLLTQMLTAQGGRVIAAVSTEEKLAAARSAGAILATRYEDAGDAVEEITDGAGVDVVFDGVGAPTFGRSLAYVRRRGLVVVFGAAGGKVPPVELSQLSGAGSVRLVRPRLVDFIADRDELLRRANDLFASLADGDFDVSIGGTFPLSAVADAHRALESRATSGKLILIPD